MCVIAGYLGTERAAPVLVEMMRREEGFAGGFYTGIVTLHEGRLYHEKVVGDLETLLANTRALELPGSIGLIHSRTPSGGGRAWAHPFIDAHEELAYIANGAMGLYADRVDFTAEAAALAAAGYTFSSAQEGAVSRYPRLPDGRCAHFSDIACQAIAADYRKEPEGAGGADRLRNAASKAYQRLPGGIVGLCLHVDRPDEIAAVRHNKPLEIARLRDGSMVMASGALAFPAGVEWEMRMPCLSSATITRSGEVRVAPFTREDLIPVGPMPSAVAVAEVAVGPLREKGCLKVHELMESTVPLWPAGMLNEKEIVTYNLMRHLVAEGKAELRTVRVPGVEPGLSAPQTWVHWLS